jgi:hypothetical protein
MVAPPEGAVQRLAMKWAAWVAGIMGAMSGGFLAGADYRARAKLTPRLSPGAVQQRHL